MNYANIKKYDIANGVGVRVSLFVSGCTHHCKGCFNAEAWDFAYGQPYTEATEEEILTALSHEYIAGLSLLGGEPFEPVNQRALLPLIRRVRREFPKKNIWAYTGYCYENDLLPGKRAFCEVTDEILDSLEVLVDGPFLESRKNISLRFRGSDNQRLIHMPETRRTGRVVLLPDRDTGSGK